MSDNEEKKVSGNEKNEFSAVEQAIDWTTTSWIYKLTNTALILILRKFVELDSEFAFDEKENIDSLRKAASNSVKARNARDNIVGSDLEKSDKLAPKDKNMNKANVNANEITEQNLNSIEMSGNDSNLEFNLGTDDWELYTERLELFFVANGIQGKPGKQVPVLLTKISAETYKLIRDLCAPTKPKDKTFDELVKLVKDRLCPKPSETMKKLPITAIAYRDNRGVRGSSEKRDNALQFSGR